MTGGQAGDHDGGGSVRADHDRAFAHQVHRAAEEAFARVMTGVDEQVARLPPGLELSDALRWLGDRVSELVAGFAELPLDRLAGLGVPGAEHPDRDHHQHPAADGATAPPGEPIIVRAARGSTAEVRVWVHLVGAVPAATLRLGLSDLLRPDGTTWLRPAADLAPAQIALPGDGSTSAVLRLPIPADAVPGAHHGLVVGHGVAGAAVPITVVIT